MEQILKKKILIVDDDRTWLHLLKNILSKAGHDVIAAISGKEALLRVFSNSNEKEFDLLITDLHMPQINGIELIDRLKSAGVGIPIVVLSGSADGEMRTKLTQKGCLECLLKPINSKELVKKVNRILS